MHDGPLKGEHVKRVAIVFAGGPAPAANAVISAAATSFIEDGREVVGFFHGYSNLQEYHPLKKRLLPDEHYRVFTERDLRGLRNTRGIIIGTSRSNPGKAIDRPEDLDDEEKTEKLRSVYNALVDLDVDALISIGGDDTLKTANLLFEFQRHLPEEARRFQVVHLPKTIDNDYRGIDFTFGFFTAVDVMAKEIQNLRADSIATSSYFIVETMGRKAGWLSYGVAIAGEASLVLAVEDVDDSLLEDETIVDPESGEETTHRRLSMAALADRIVRRLEGVVIARAYSLLEYNVPSAKLAEAEKITPGFNSPTVNRLEDENWRSVRVMVKRGDVIEIMEQLETLGATAILETSIANCRL